MQKNASFNDSKARRTMSEKLHELEIEKISINPFQPRRQFDQLELEELAASIKSVGLIQPIVVRQIGSSFELIAGERRLRASRLAGFTKVPAVIKYKSDSLTAEMALIENVQRVDLNPIEIAKALKSLSMQCDLNQEDLAKKIGKKRSTIANYLRLLTLPDSIQQSVAKGEISMGHAKAILSLEDGQMQHAIHLKIIAENLTVRQAENLIRKMCSPIVAKATLDHQLSALEKEIQQRLGTKVSIEGGKNQQGVIKIAYHSWEDLDRILTLMGVVV